MDIDLIEELNNKIDEMDLDWSVYGIIDKNDEVYSLKNDSKMIGRVFELLAAPAIKKVAEDNSMEVIPAESQTIYPDFTLEMDISDTGEDKLKKGDEIISISDEEISCRNDVEEVIDDVNSDENDEDDNLEVVIKRDNNLVDVELNPMEFFKIAIDVKTTYRQFYRTDYREYSEGDVRPFKFTLGSFGSFLRNHTKNIQYDYRSYCNHFIVGFLYTRVEEVEEGLVKPFESRTEIECPFENVDYFIQEKYKIAGISPGSGNTENIGSFKTNNINDLEDGNGPFSDYGKDAFEEYWKNYGRYREDDTFKNIDEFLEWRQPDEDENSDDENEEDENSEYVEADLDDF